MRYLLGVLLCAFSSMCYSSSEIRMAPSILQGPRKNIIYRSDEPVVLECKSGGIPAVKYQWKKDGSYLNLNLPNIKKLADGSINITSATSLDEGIYQCFATNPYGTAVSEASHIQRAILESGGSSVAPFPKTVIEGEPFQLQCDQRRSFPKPTYSWELAIDTVDKTPETLRETKRIQIAENGDLHFAFAKLEDSQIGRIYKCATYNPPLDIKAGGSYTKLTVTPSSNGLTKFAPILGFSSQVQTVALIGKDVNLRCFFSGNPEPSSITWTGPKNTLPVGRYTIGKFDTELAITNVAATDEGDYVCTAKNENGTSSKTLQIRVDAEPTFQKKADHPHDVNITEGRSVSFNCSSNAKPEATVVWFWNGKLIDVKNPPTRFIFTNKEKRLTINDVCRDCHDQERHTDLMVIQCNASNDHGYAFAAGYINVLKKTQWIGNYTWPSRINVYSDEERKIQFNCSGTSDPSTSVKAVWRKVVNGTDQHLQKPQCLINRDGKGLLTIARGQNKTCRWEELRGVYKCIVDNGYSVDVKTVELEIAQYPSNATYAAPASLPWWLFSVIIIGAGVIVIVIFISLYLAKEENKSDVYKIDEQERWNGKDPIKEVLDDGFEVFQPTEYHTRTLQGSKASISCSTLLRIDEEASLNGNEYVSDCPFTEDGSFVGTYRNA